MQILKNIKKLRQKKDEINQQLADAIAVAQRLGTENKRLVEDNETLRADNAKLKEEFDSAIERVRYLAEQIKMKEAQQQATDNFNDNDRNY